MLNKEEEQRLSSFLDATKAELQRDTKYDPEYYTSAIKWLAEKLKETNDELDLKDREFKILISQHATEVLELRKRLEEMTKKYDRVSTI